MREEVALGGGKWPVCKEHMICKFDDLSEIGKKKLSGDKTWTDWYARQSKARDLNEDFKMERASIIKDRSNSMSSRTESLRSTLANPFTGFDENTFFDETTYERPEGFVEKGVEENSKIAL